MNVGRYLKGEDRHIGTARTTKAKKENSPMNTPLPCDVKVGHVTIRKGVALSVLVARMQVLYEMALLQQQKPLTDEQLEKGRDQTFSINNPFCPCDSKTFRKVARWVEAAHNIKE